MTSNSLEYATTVTFNPSQGFNLYAINSLTPAQFETYKVLMHADTNPKLQPQQLEWCAQHIPGFKDLLV